MKSSTDGNAASAPPQPAGKAGDLKLRVLSALVMAPVVLAAVWAGGWVLRALLVAAALLAVAEWVNLVPSTRRSAALLSSGAGVVASLVTLIALGAGAAVGVAALFILVVALAGGGRDRTLLGIGVFYVSLGLIGLDWLRDRPDDGLALFLYAMLAVWATDIGAYAAGRSIGGPKLAPRISPKKTWAGLIGGMVSAGLAGWAVAEVAGAAQPLLALLVAAMSAVVAQAGDLFESAVKRRYDIKDSGHLIPGHGGILDRIDGLLVAAPVLALFHATIGTAVSWW
ncbi:phosphatidate cytidylyltransferase [Azospirillum thermophilum]|uniref:Phosphatidate cytidylyltransferase n=1 Tax=Azospirillum thermophilum TaxID=2202148 RepID=A0A2S2CMS2_9PROT|nr:phosphatidate cytidylyltransferase [Azospirillum thermophilum]AWK85766.1 phosphatidate cytidylyltransferase [Azospirillum thermophilum]